LQWDPGKSRMNYYNTLDVLANRYPEVELPNVPSHQVLEADRGANFATITRNHLALLDQNAAIKERFLGEPDWLNLYGLPIRYEEREVNGNPQGLQLLRAQRTVFVIWNVPAPGTTVGRVNLQNVPDKVKRLSNVIIPPVARHEVAGLPVFTLTPPSAAQSQQTTAGARFIAISSGDYHSCALRADGEPVCWGVQDGAQRPGFGQVGFGQSNPPEGERFAAIDSGGQHTCALRQDGTAVCWGRDNWGQASPPDGERFVSISSGGAHTCGLREDGTAVCWGSDESSQSTPPEGERFTAISSGSFHTCGLRVDGIPICWGPEPYWDGHTGWEAPPEVPLLVVDSAYGYTCGIELDGSPICWGARSDVVYSGQYPRSYQRLTAISGRASAGQGGCGLWTNGTAVCWGWVDPPPERQKFTAISSGREHTCGIRRDDGALVCWGSDEKTQTYAPRGAHSPAPEETPPNTTGPDVSLASIISGGVHVCGLDASGTAWCWGDDGYGRSSPPVGQKFTSVSSGWAHTCGVRLDGAIACWGDDDFGQAAPPAGGGFVAVSSGSNHTCALRSDGAAVCWGSDRVDQTSVPEGERFTAISSGWSHTCGLRADGTAVCWGSDLFGRGSPPAGETFTAISGSWVHTCGLRPDGTAVCWGDNDEGQASPPAGEGLVRISANASHTCGLRADGTPVCWGEST
ncbi:MAG: hypothetical protein OXF96_10195, partial [Chloroflexi bacterium]|nr:hypothetical protein [Chloroflexota bacterium]